MPTPKTNNIAQPDSTEKFNFDASIAPDPEAETPTAPSFIPSDFATTGKPEMVTNGKGFRDRGLQSRIAKLLSQGRVIKLFELTHPVNPKNEAITEQYQTQYELVVYREGKACEWQRLDADKAPISCP